MIRTGAIWFLGLVVSMALHAVALLALAFATKPDPVPPQAVPQTRLDMATYQVDRSDAPERAAPSRRAGEVASEATSLGSVAVPSSRTGGSDLLQDAVAPISTASEPSGAVVPDGQDVSVMVSAPDALAVLSDAGTRLVERTPELGLAQEQTPAADRISVADEAPTAIGEALFEGDRTVPVTLPFDAAEPAAPTGTVLAVAIASALATRAEAAVGQAEPLRSVPSNAQGLKAQAANATPAKVAAPVTTDVAARRAPAAESRVLAPASEAALSVASTPEAVPLGAARARPDTLIPAAMPALQQPPEVLSTERAEEQSVAAAAESPAAEIPRGQRATASLAWSGAGEVDPISLAAIQAFMRPGDLDLSGSSLGRVQDSIATILASVPCARLQTTFRPETGALELQGHIPEEDLRGPVLAALQAQVGGAIPVADNLLILPRPQCGALSGIAGVGLPQSTDQLTNPRVIGPDTHARVYEFSNGQRLSFDLEGPDYDAVIYIDYYDAEGMVLHLQPNEIVGLALVPAKATFVVGGAMAGGPSLDIIVAPPFGQEIMVAMAASHPLYEGLRPIREPAGDYLRFMTERVAEARATHADFKGEWVYFFVKTTP